MDYSSALASSTVKMGNNHTYLRKLLRLLNKLIFTHHSTKIYSSSIMYLSLSYGLRIQMNIFMDLHGRKRKQVITKSNYEMGGGRNAVKKGG